MFAEPVCVSPDGRTAADRGWNSWLAFGCSGDNMTGSLTAQIVTETADAMVSTGLKAKGYEYVNLCVALPTKKILCIPPFQEREALFLLVLFFNT